MAEFLLEIGLEEAPARMLPSAQAELGERLRALLAREQLLEAGAEIRTYSTPRRLAALARGVALQQPDRTEVLTGPSWAVAFREGVPTPAAVAFARKAGVDVSRLKPLTTAKGEYASVTVARTGRAAAELLAENISKELTALNWPKPMYWRPGKPERFVRPVQWLVALLDGHVGGSVGETVGESVVPLEFAGVRAGSGSRGHRVLHGEAPVQLGRPGDYVDALLAAHVMVDARRIAIETQDGRGRDLPQQLDLVLGQRCAERGDRRAESRLVQRDHIHIALNRNHAVGARGGAGEIDAVEGAPLGKNRGFGAVDVFGLRVAQGAAAEADDAAAAVADREHDAVEEQLAAWRTVLAGAQQAGFQQARRRDRLAGQRLGQRTATLAGPAQAEAPDRGVGQAAAPQIGQCGRPCRRGEIGLVVGRGGLQHLVQVEPPLLALRGGRRGLGDIEPGLARQHLHGIHEGAALRLHDEADRVAMRAAAEAMVAVVINVEAGAFLVVERAAGFPLPARAHQLDAAADQRRDRRAGP